MTASALFDLFAPELASNPNKASYLSIAATRISCVYGNLQNQAIALLAAHLTTIAASGGGTSGGTITGKRQGGRSISYASPNITGDVGDLSQTAYGRHLLQLKKERYTGASITGGGLNGLIC